MRDEGRIGFSCVCSRCIKESSKKHGAVLVKRPHSMHSSYVLYEVAGVSYGEAHSSKCAHELVSAIVCCYANKEKWLSHFNNKLHRGIFGSMSTQLMRVLCSGFKFSLQERQMSFMVLSQIFESLVHFKGHFRQQFFFVCAILVCIGFNAKVPDFMGFTDVDELMEAASVRWVQEFFVTHLSLCAALFLGECRPHISNIFGYFADYLIEKKVDFSKAT